MCEWKTSLIVKIFQIKDSIVREQARRLFEGFVICRKDIAFNYFVNFMFMLAVLVAFLMKEYIGVAIVDGLWLIFLLWSMKREGELKNWQNRNVALLKNLFEENEIAYDDSIFPN